MTSGSVSIYFRSKTIKLSNRDHIWVHPCSRSAGGQPFQHSQEGSDAHDVRGQRRDVTSKHSLPPSRLASQETTAFTTTEGHGHYQRQVGEWAGPPQTSISHLKPAVWGSWRAMNLITVFPMRLSKS